MGIIETTKEMMQSDWYHLLLETGLWTIEWIFFTILIQVSIMVFTKIYFIGKFVDSKTIDDSLTGLMVLFSMISALFVKIYLV